MRSSQHARQHDARMFWLLHRFDRAVAIELQSDTTSFIRSMWNLSKSKDRFVSSFTVSPILKTATGYTRTSLSHSVTSSGIAFFINNVNMADGKGL